uniref:K Homology domain-containing protein n=1 Tax=Acrobeloides nanus TaxID=290746 RepID=A0A914CKN3_9BILA
LLQQIEHCLQLTPTERPTITAIKEKAHQMNAICVEPIKKNNEESSLFENQLITGSIEVPQKFVGYVIVKNGYRIQEIKEESRCVVVKTAPEMRSDVCSIIFQGTPKQINHAKMLISNLVASASAFEKQQQSSLKENKFQPTGRHFDT